MAFERDWDHVQEENHDANFCKQRNNAGNMKETSTTRAPFDDMHVVKFDIVGEIPFAQNMWIKNVLTRTTSISFATKKGILSNTVLNKRQ